MLGCFTFPSLIFSNFFQQTTENMGYGIMELATIKNLPGNSLSGEPGYFDSEYTVVSSPRQ